MNTRQWVWLLPVYWFLRNLAGIRESVSAWIISRWNFETFPLRGRCPPHPQKKQIWGPHFGIFGEFLGRLTQKRYDADVQKRIRCASLWSLETNVTHILPVATAGTLKYASLNIGKKYTFNWNRKLKVKVNYTMNFRLVGVVDRVLEWTMPVVAIQVQRTDVLNHCVLGISQGKPI